MALCCHKRDLTAHNNNIHLYSGILYLVKHDVSVIIYGNNLLFIMWKVRHTENETHNLTRKTRCFLILYFVNNFRLFKTVVSAEAVFNQMSAHPMFKIDKNLWFNVYPNEEHSNQSWIRRLWNTFKILAKDRN